LLFHPKEQKETTAKAWWLVGGVGREADFSTTQPTIKLWTASVEMTVAWGWRSDDGRNKKQIPPLRCGMTNKKDGQTQSATAKTNTGVLRCAQNDNFEDI
jgi:hypothetical protein